MDGERAWVRSRVRDGEWFKSVSGLMWRIRADRDISQQALHVALCDELWQIEDAGSGEVWRLQGSAVGTSVRRCIYRTDHENMPSH